MKISYDRSENILMICMEQKGAIDHAEHSGSFIAHFSESGKLLLLEVLHADEIIPSLVKASLSEEAEVILED